MTLLVSNFTSKDKEMHLYVKSPSEKKIKCVHL
jgi:hypothetical protein